MAVMLSRRERFMRAQLSDYIKEGMDLRERLGQLRDKNRELEYKLRALNCDPNAINALKALQDRNDALRREIHRLKRENSLIHRELAYGRYAEATVKEIQRIKEQLAAVQTLQKVATQPVFLTIKGCADMLQCSPSHIRHLIDRGELPFSRVGRRIRLRAEAVLAALGRDER